MSFLYSIKPNMESKNLNTPNVYYFIDLQMPALMWLKRMAGRTFSAEKFAGIIDKIFSKGFVNVNGGITPLADYVNYKAYYQIEEFADVNGHKIVLEFIKEFVGGRIYYYIKEVTVE